MISWIMQSVAALTMLCCVSAHASTVLDAVRVYAIQPDCFEYLFTSVVSEFGGRPVLSFNNLSGETFFVTVGDTVGEYTVNTFEPRTERIFNSSINAYQKKRADRVTLDGPDGKSITLERGKLLPRTGWMAWLVSLDSGNWRRVRRKDMLILGNTKIMIDAISENSVTVSVAGTRHTVSPISEEEKEEISLLWEKRRKQKEEKAKFAMKRREAECEQQVVAEAARPRRLPRRVVEVRYPSRLFFGTEYRYPTEFQVITVPGRTASGTLTYQTVVVPKRFEARTSGMSIQYR